MIKQVSHKKKKPRLTPSIKIACEISIIIAIVFAAWLFIYPDSKAETATYEKVEIIPSRIMEKMESDIPTPGMHTYPDGNETYVLLTLGETSGFAMNITPFSDSKSTIHFKISATRVSSDIVDYEYCVYKTDATAISADETVLKNPGYGVGSSGTNIGYVEKTKNGAYYIVPLFDTAPTDRVFLDEVGSITENGLYRYVYEIRSTGAFGTEAENLPEYTVFAIIERISNDETIAHLLLSEEKTGLPVHIEGLDEASKETLQAAVSVENHLKVKLSMKNGVLTLVEIVSTLGESFQSQEGGHLIEE